MTTPFDWHAEHGARCPEVYTTGRGKSMGFSHEKRRTRGPPDGLPGDLDAARNTPCAAYAGHGMHGKPPKAPL